MDLRDLARKLFNQAQTPESAVPLAVAPQFAEIDDYYLTMDVAYTVAYTDWRKARVLTDALLQSLSSATAITCLLSRDGYAREFSLRVLLAQDGVAAFRQVVQRLNDFVPINRELAQQLVLRWIVALPIELIVDALPDLYALEQQSRADFKSVMDALRNRLSEPEGRHAVMAGICHGRATVRLRCWQICLQMYEWSTMEKVEHALASGDVVLAYKVEALVYALTDDEISHLLLDPNRLTAMPLRRAVYLTAWRRKLIEPTALIERALWDTSFSIRWMARMWAKEMPDFLANQYRRVLAQSSSVRQKRCALEGLAQLRQLDTLDCCRAALGDMHPSVRKSALEALCKIDVERRNAYLRSALWDPDVAVIRKCFEISIQMGEHFTFDELEPVAHERRADSEFFAYLIHYAQNVSGWLGIHFTSLCRVADETVQAGLKPRVAVYIQDWARLQIYTAPTLQQWSEASAWLQVDKLDARSELRFIFETQAKRLKPST